MRKTREILRLRWGQKLSLREVARSVRCSSSTVVDCEGRARVAGLSWPLPEELDDAQLEALLYRQRGASSRERPAPDFKYVHEELRRKGVTLLLLWQEYRAEHGEAGLQYSTFCDRYRRWRAELDVVMRQHHAPGERLFVDYGGQSVTITHPVTGEQREAQVFVAALGASNYTYAEAVDGEELGSWASAHVRCFDELGDAPAVWVPDNLKSGVTRPCFYDPDINPTYAELAEHDDAVVLPARVRKPRDNAKVENAVLQVERWVLAPLRKQRFFSLAEANRAIRERLDVLNDKPLSKLDTSRRQLLEQVDRPALLPLPDRRFELAERKPNVTVHIDYHVEYDGHYYSAPHTLARKKVDIRATATTIELLYNGRRVASHRRSAERGRHTTLDEHRPAAHREHAGWSPERVAKWASTIGPHTSQLARAIMASRRHPEQGCRACLGVIRLAKRYGNERLELACGRALELRSPSYATVRSMLKAGLEAPPVPARSTTTSAVDHHNVRGPTYYN